MGIVDQSRVKIVGIYHGSSKVETVIEAAAPATDETTSTNTTDNSTQNANSSVQNSTASAAGPSVLDLSTMLSASIKSGGFVTSMKQNAGLDVLQAESSFYQHPDADEDESVEDSLILIGAISAACVVIVIVVGLVIICRKNKEA